MLFFLIGHGWEIVNGKCKPVHHTLPSLLHLLISPDRSAGSGDEIERDYYEDLEDSTDSVEH